MTQLWNKGERLDAAVLAYTVGDDYKLDERLVTFDVRASQAHASMLAAQGYLTRPELEQLHAALADLGARHAGGEWTIALDEEDAHTAIENRLVAALGNVGKKIHLGRSRNDQVLAALRLYLKDVVVQLTASGHEVMARLQDVETTQGTIPLPGYTHGQRAMPSSVALWASGFRAELEDDLAGLAGALRRIDKNPLGSAAGFGTPGLSIDREATRRELGFGVVHEPVTAVQLSRGKAEAGLVFELCLWMNDLGRLAADICLFATAEFGFVRLPDTITTGSSIMPQKRNPDVFELVRARAVQLPAELVAILNVVAKLPSGYHRDLQLLKPPLFRAIDTTSATLAILTHALPTLRFDADRTRQAMDPALFATEAAYRLVVEQGQPFRDAYRQVAAQVAAVPPGTSKPPA